MPDLRPKLSFANVTALLALFIALGGSAYAVKIKLKTNAVKSKHIAPDAATGEDVNESTLGNVPSATNATNATNAGNATTVGGVSADGLQFGDGFDDAFADVIEAPDTGGILLIEGAVGIKCEAPNPDIAYRDLGGDPFDTDLWRNGQYVSVADGADAPLLDLGAPDATARAHLWGGAGVVGDVTASVHLDTTFNPDQCTVAFTSQENLDNDGVIFLGGERADRGDLEARRQLPDGWVPLDGR